jgi:uracil-DNA glycosylase
MLIFMQLDEFGFLIKEYASLWGDAGVEESGFAHLSPEGIESLSLRGSPLKATPRDETLESIREDLGDCRRCGLCSGRNKIVFGAGNPKARLVFVGEGPGVEEDTSGLPFVGQAGKLLDKIIEAMGYLREDVYIANVVKCRPPDNRAPLPEEVEKCVPFLQRQIHAIGPEVIVALGTSASHALTGSTSSMASQRSRPHPLIWDPKITVMPTYHPAYLLRNPSAKRLVWDDMKKVKSHLEEPS